MKTNESPEHLLQKLAPKAFRNTTLLNNAVTELRKMYDRKPFAGTEKMTFTQFIRAYAEYAMTA